jgi:uncharacterized protein YwgA
MQLTMAPTKRDKAQAIWDRIALLNLLRLAQSPETVDNLKVQKLTFLSELEGINNKICVAHYPFFRYRLGPFSKELANDLTFLEKFVFVDSESRELTARGKFILEYVHSALEESEDAKSALALAKQVCDKYKNYRSSALVDIVYGMTVPVDEWGGKPCMIKDIPECTDILNPLNASIRDVQLSPELLLDIDEEFAIPPEQLQISRPAVAESINAALRRAIESS